MSETVNTKCSVCLTSTRPTSSGSGRPIYHLELHTLTRTSYETLTMAPLDALLRRMAFLLGFATAVRILELHMLDITMVRSR